MQSYEGYFENGKFYTAGKIIKIPERKNISLTIHEEFSPQLLKTNKKTKINNKNFWLEFDRLVNESMDEVLDYECFKRSQVMKEPVNLSDEE